MKSTIKQFAVAAAFFCSCCSCNKSYEMGTYGYDLEYLAKKNIPVVELSSADGKSKLMVVPAWQGRVMTSTTDGNEGISYGWINYRFIDAGEPSGQFNPFGGEERFWIGPEGGPFSWYFKKGQEQVYVNWKVPAAIDTDTYDIESKFDDSIVFVKTIEAVNASDVNFRIGVKRTVALLTTEELESVIGVSLPEGVKSIAYKTENTLTNLGDEAWTKETGMPSVWLLGSFNPTPTTTVFIPYNQEFSGKIVNDEYFGKVPAERLVVDNGMIYFKIDGEYRSKIGLPSGSAKDICGSYDSKAGVLNILKYTVPERPADYVNGQWGPQEDPFSGDVINSYNDGPTDAGTIMGPFYEIETSSPGAALEKGKSLTHVQHTIHIQGKEEQLSSITQLVFGISLEKVSSIFSK